MRVAHLLRKYNPSEWGGTESAMLQLTSAMASQGVQPALYAPRIPRAAAGEPDPRSARGGFPGEEVPCRRSDLGNLARDERPDGRRRRQHDLVRPHRVPLAGQARPDPFARAGTSGRDRPGRGEGARPALRGQRSRRGLRPSGGGEGGAAHPVQGGLGLGKAVWPHAPGEEPPQPGGRHHHLQSQGGRADPGAPSGRPRGGRVARDRHLPVRAGLQGRGPGRASRTGGPPHAALAGEDRPRQEPGVGGREGGGAVPAPSRPPHHVRRALHPTANTGTP